MIANKKGILITRPLAQIEPFAEKLRALGYAPVLAPTVEIISLAQDPNTLAQIQQFSKAPLPQHLIITSQNALLQASPDLLNCLKPIPHVWVMGPSSSKLAKSYGFCIAKEPTKGNTSEELVEYIQKQYHHSNPQALEISNQLPNHLSGSHVLILGGKGGRGALEELFAAQNVACSRIDTYEQLCPVSNYDWHPLQGVVKIGLFTSLATLQNAMRLFGPEGTQWLQSIPIIVVSQRIQNFALEQGFKTDKVFISDSASEEDCLRQILALNNLF